MDDGACLKIWDGKKQAIVAEEPRFSNGLLATCAIEESEGRLIACGGIDGKVHVFSVNKQTSKKRDDTIKVL